VLINLLNVRRNHTVKLISDTPLFTFIPSLPWVALGLKDFSRIQLAIATGAGSGSRQSLGTAVFGGMPIATFLSLFLVPILYIAIEMAAEKLWQW
jgi:hypothetical protein